MYYIPCHGFIYAHVSHTIYSCTHILILLYSFVLSRSGMDESIVFFIMGLYSRPPVARTLMARLPRLFRTRY